MYDTSERRWRAVQSRDRFAASAFVYAVKTTRIFCRPTCPARLARRANVTFFDNCTDAAAASFRPCKRCRPEQADGIDSMRKTVEAAQTFMQEQRGLVTLEQLAKHLKLSSRYLHHVFSKHVGCTPAVYAASIRQMQQESITALVGEVENTFPITPELSEEGTHVEAFNQLDWLTASSKSTPPSDVTPFGEIDWQGLDFFCSSTWPNQPVIMSTWLTDLDGQEELSEYYAQLPTGPKFDEGFLKETTLLQEEDLASL